MSTALLEVDRLSRWFHKNQPAEVLAVAAVSLTLRTGDFAVLIGANGSGKTTLLNLIAGSLTPHMGSIRINGQDITRWPDYKRSRYIARIFQDPLLGTAPDLTVLDNFRLSYLRTRSKTLRWGITTGFRTEVRDYVASLGLGMEQNLEKEVRLLSGGQRQAISLLMATLTPPTLLLLDEPTAALDPRTSESVMQLADQLISRQRLTALMVTHNLKHAVQYGNRLLVMRNGTLAADYAGQQKQQLTMADLQQWFY
ncbi:MAG: ATP-binding cassette domain-containing protein [Chitinophagales bacterium]|nr:ATP-binding cassette domain-containing protein [Chitinophagales bacterium]MDW8394512.1 ATP-binding cassette domain-containing protein [Chitinophagales bacterium]